MFESIVYDVYAAAVRCPTASGSEPRTVAPAAVVTFT